MEIIKRIFLVIIIAIHTFCINAQTYESMEKLSSKIAKEIQKGNNKKAFKYYQRAIEIQKEHPDSLELYFPLIYTETSPGYGIVTSIIEYVATYEEPELAEKWICESARMWIKQMNLIRSYGVEQGDEGNLKTAFISMSGILGLRWAGECAMADLDSLGDFSYPCDIFFDEAMNIGIQSEIITDDNAVSEEDKYWFLDYLEYLAIYYAYYRNDCIRAARAYVEYWSLYIDVSEFSSEDLEIIQRMLFCYDCAIEKIWDSSITEKSLNYIEDLIKDWQILRIKIIDKQGADFFNEMIANYLSNNFCGYPEYFGYVSYDYYINVIVNIRKENLEALWQYVDLYLDSVTKPKELLDDINHILPVFENCGMAAASFNFLKRCEQYCVKRNYDQKYVIGIQTLLANRYLYYREVKQAKDILYIYITNVDSFRTLLSPNQYFFLLRTICELYLIEENWDRFKYYADIMCEHIKQYTEEIDKEEIIRFYYELAYFYKIQGDSQNHQKYIEMIFDVSKYKTDEIFTLELDSYIMCCAIIENCYNQIIKKEGYKVAIRALSQCVDFLKRTGHNYRQEGTAYKYLIYSSRMLKNYELHKHYYEEFYGFIVRYFYHHIFSLSSSARAELWNDYSDCLENVSGEMLINKSIIDVSYNFALLQKNHLLKYNNLIRNNIYASKDSLLINAYEELVRARDSKVSNSIQLERKLMDLYSSHIEFRNSHRVYVWQDVQRQLGKNDLAVEFTVCYKEDTNSYAALLLKKDWDSPKMIELCEETELKRIMSSGASLYKENAEAYSCIWEKLEPYFKKGDNIYFAPHGLIHQLNIEVLCGADGKPMNKKCNLYRLSSTGNLVDKREDLKYTSATLFGGLNYDTDTTSMVAINRKYVTSPSYQRGGMFTESVQTRAELSYLPGTAEEVRNVGNILDRNKIETTTYTDEVGTEESFKALSGNSTPIIHIATHGFYLEDKDARKEGLYEFEYSDIVQTISPLKRSGLIFSGGQHAWLGREIPEGIDDGVLTAEEIAEMNLTGTDLLVLSACQTGLGEITNEGVEGLQRGFKIAGVNTIIMSLWKVSDAGTEVLMTKFYSLLIKGKTKREAFDAAVEAVKKEYPSPEYWAAFIMLD